jgi:hypothetical protein
LYLRNASRRFGQLLGKCGVELNLHRRRAARF